MIELISPIYPFNFKSFFIYLIFIFILTSIFVYIHLNYSYYLNSFLAYYRRRDVYSKIASQFRITILISLPIFCIIYIFILEIVYNVSYDTFDNYFWESRAVSYISSLLITSTFLLIFRLLANPIKKPKIFLLREILEQARINNLNWKDKRNFDEFFENEKILNICVNHKKRIFNLFYSLHIIILLILYYLTLYYITILYLFPSKFNVGISLRISDWNYSIYYLNIYIISIFILVLFSEAIISTLNPIVAEDDNLGIK